MRIIIKKTILNNKHNKKITDIDYLHEFNDIKTDDTWNDFNESYDASNTSTKGASFNSLNFSFKISEVNDNSIMLTINSDFNKKIKDSNITLYINDSFDFDVKTPDIHFNYSISLLDDELEKDKLSLYQFYNEFRRCRGLDKVDISIYAPVIYSMERKFYNAAIKLLQSKTITHLTINNYNIIDILDGYWLDKEFNQKKYLEALIILNNLKTAGDDAYKYFNPYNIL